MLRNLRFCQCLSLARVAHQLLAWLPMDYLSRSYASELLGSPFELLAHDTVAHIWAQPKAWHEPRFFRMHPRAAQTWGQSEIPTQQARPGSRGIQNFVSCSITHDCWAQWCVGRAIGLCPQHCASSEWMPLGSFFGQVGCMEILCFEALTAAATSWKNAEWKDSWKHATWVVPSEFDEASGQ